MDGLIFSLGINPLEQVAEPVDAGFVELAWPGGHNLPPVSQASPIWLAARLLGRLFAGPHTRFLIETARSTILCAFLVHVIGDEQAQQPRRGFRHGLPSGARCAQPSPA